MMKAKHSLIWVYLAVLIGVMSGLTYSYTSPGYFWGPSTTQTTTRSRPTTITSTAAPDHAFTLRESTGDVVVGITRNVSLDCEFNTILSRYTMEEISRIRILQADSYQHWHLVAEIRDNEVGIHLYDHITASGHIDRDISKSYLRIMWPTAQASTLGRFRCDVSGFDRNLNVASETSNIVEIGQHDITAKEVFDVLTEERARLQKKLDVQQEAIKSLESKYNQLMSSCDGQNQSYTEWPEGWYSLLSPFTGCPRDPNLRRGFIKLHAESDGNSYNSSVPTISNLPPYTLLSAGNDNFVVLTFCTAIKDNGGSAWPSGSYCINRDDRTDCPRGFYVRYIRITEETTDWKGSHGGLSPHYYKFYQSYAVMHFCCRSDGTAHQPIILPTEDPFYLYSYGGTCQNVLGMNMTEEYLIVDTENTYNNDSYGNHYHPDGSLSDVRLELCYYQPIV